MSKEDNNTDILDDIRKVDKKIRVKLLVEKIKQLKEFAREINELKERMKITLEEMDVEEEDIKRIIDYINETPEVKLNEVDKQQIRKDVQEEVKEEKEQTDFDWAHISSDWSTTTTNNLDYSLSSNAGLEYDYQGSTSSLSLKDSDGVEVTKLSI